MLLLLLWLLFLLFCWKENAKLYSFSSELPVPPTDNPLPTGPVVSYFCFWMTSFLHLCFSCLLVRSKSDSTNVNNQSENYRELKKNLIYKKLFWLAAIVQWLSQRTVDQKVLGDYFLCTIHLDQKKEKKFIRKVPTFFADTNKKVYKIQPY